MPIHDWKRVDAGIFHDFHLGWIAELRKTLNGGLLPKGFYALAEPVVGGVVPDVLALHAGGRRKPHIPHESGMTTLAVAPPRVRVTAKAELASYTARQRRLAIRHSSGDRIVALVELVSQGNKSSRDALRKFVEKAVAALDHGYHLLIVDLFPPSRLNPRGIHGAIWEEMGENGYRQPRDKPLTLAAYAAGEVVTAYVEPTAVGDALADMPLFLAADAYVPVPLEATYRTAWQGVPERWREVLEP